MKDRQDLFLKFRHQIDQKVAADEDIQFGKGGVHDDVLRGEGNHLPYLLADPVAVFFLDKKPLQAIGRYVRGDAPRIDPLAGPVYRLPV